MTVSELLKHGRVILDGGMGTLLQAQGLSAGELPETWNLLHPDIIQSIHKSYLKAGTQIISTNTFGANCLKYNKEDLRKIIFAAVKNSRTACDGFSDRFVALDIGPTGKLLKPLGDLDFEDAVSVFADTVLLGVEAGVDLILIETMNDGYETKAALLAAKENSSLPVFVSNAYGEDGKLMTGATPECMVAMLEGMGADAVGVNCSFGPDRLKPVVERYLVCASVPVLLKPNAGLPRVADGKTVFGFTPEAFADCTADLVRHGVNVVGGCCGTTPDYIRALCDKIKDIPVVLPTEKNISVVSSYSRTVSFGTEPVLIGERINPTGKKRFRQALLDNETDYILQEGIREQEAGAHVLDVNVGIPDINEPETLKDIVEQLSAVTDLPLQIDTSDFVAMEKAMRVYNGKPLVNSVNGKESSMTSVFPLVKKYGGVIVALTLDENGIPPTAEGRVSIAQKILKKGAEYGLRKKDFLFDTLTMTVSADANAALVTLQATKALHEMGCLTTLGVSNVSFGLPDRDTVNAAFFSEALTVGLNAAIMNPFSEAMMKTYRCYNLLHGYDKNGMDYIAYTQAHESKNTVTHTDTVLDINAAVIKGLKERAASLTAEKIKTADPLSVVSDDIIPALDTVGKGFETKTVFLPQLLMSAEAAKAAFDVIKSSMKSDGIGKDTVILATVQGDIHDIGKNIVKLLLENYGYTVLDLGKDVAPEKIVDAVLKSNVSLVGLSALMTTTVPAMEETIKQVHTASPSCKIVVGGAVLTEEYARKIGADYYAKDAMDTVRIAKEVFQ